MKALILTLIILTTNISTSLAQAKVLTKGTPAPYTGVLIENTSFNNLVKSEKQLKVVEKQNIVLKDLRIVLEERVDYHQGVAKGYRTELQRSEIKRFWTNMAYFGLGVLMTGVAFKVALEITE